MANEYISKQYAVNAINDALKRVFTEHVGEGIINPLKPADVVPVEILKAEIYKLKHQSEQGFGNHDYYVGYISALSTVEGILAVMIEE